MCPLAFFKCFLSNSETFFELESLHVEFGNLPRILNRTLCFMGDKLL